MRLEDAQRKAVRGARNMRSMIRRAIASLSMRHRLYSRLFCAGEGDPTPDAKAFLADLAREARVDVTGFDPDARHADYRKGMADLYRYIEGNLFLDQTKIRKLRLQLKEHEDE